MTRPTKRSTYWKLGAVTGVGQEPQLGVGEMLIQVVRVERRYDDVVASVDDENGLGDAAEVELKLLTGAVVHAVAAARCAAMVSRLTGRSRSSARVWMRDRNARPAAWLSFDGENMIGSHMSSPSSSRLPNRGPT